MSTSEQMQPEGLPTSIPINMVAWPDEASDKAKPTYQFISAVWTPVHVRLMAIAAEQQFAMR